jgi:hypothetical protein
VRPNYCQLCCDPTILTPSSDQCRLQEEIELEIGRVLFIDSVRYAKLSISDQNAIVDKLSQIIRAGDKQFQKAEVSQRLIKIPVATAHTWSCRRLPKRQCAVRRGPLAIFSPNMWPNIWRENEEWQSIIEQANVK